MYGLQDAGSKGVLQASVTKTADFDSTAIDTGSGVAPGQSPSGATPGLPVVAVINVSAIDTSDGNETYQFTVQESDDNSTFTAASIKTATTTILATGSFLIGAFIKKRYVRLDLDVSGTTPSITYSAYLRPLRLRP
jgi:hypothetical protein